MKLLADENFPRAALEALRRHGFDLAAVGEDSAGAADEQVLARCARNKLILLTLDKDFGELVFRLGLPADCGVILFRVTAQSAAEFARIVLTALKSRDDFAGSFTVVTRNQVRMRPLPLP